METIRCPRCQKLLRADALRCSRCGMTMPRGKGIKRRVLSDSGELSQPTNPLASPHRAGHYSGFHPEDQPYQSSFYMRVQRPALPEPSEADSSTLLDLRPDEPVPVAAKEAEPQEMAYLTPEDQSTDEIRRLAELPTHYPQRGPETPLPETILPPQARQRVDPPRLARLLITGSLLCFLLATGLLAFLLLSQPAQKTTVAGPPRLIALPGELRVGDVLQLSGSGFDARHTVAVTRDGKHALLDSRDQPLLATTDSQGIFLLHVPITAAWTLGTHTLQANEGHIKVSTSITIQAAAPGQPHLQPGASPVNLGGGIPGTVSRKNLTLTNTGGGRVSWSARSDQGWLTLSPSSGNFAGNMVVVLTVDRTNLAPQAYLGHLLFTQDGGATQTLTVTMAVNTSAANLVLSTASLAFGGTPAQSPAGQTMVIQNNGGQSLSWSAGSATVGGGNWLSVTPASGLLNANTSAILTVNVNTLNMALGTYQGTLSFSYPGGQVQEVAITLNVTPPPQPAMHLSQQSLNFSSVQGTNPAPQSFTIANPGNAALNWSIQADTNGQTYLAIAPTKGSVPPGQSINVTVTPLLGNASGSIKAVLTVFDSDTGTTVPRQQITVSMAITSAPVISLLNSSIEFDHSSDNTQTNATLIFTNSGSIPLNWVVSENVQVPWLSISPGTGLLPAGHTTSVDLSCDSSNMQPGTYTVTLTVKDTHAGDQAAPQSILVTLVISA